MGCRMIFGNFFSRKHRITVNELAKTFWQMTSDHKMEKLVRDFPTDLDIPKETMFLEMVVYLSFCTDFTLHGAFQKNSNPLIDSVRDSFGAILRNFVEEKQLKPLPPLHWLDNLTFEFSGPAPTQVGNPTENLKTRLGLYSKSLRDDSGKPVHECLSRTLCYICGGSDMSLSLFAAGLLNTTFEGVNNVLGAVELQP